MKSNIFISILLAQFVFAHSLSAADALDQDAPEESPASAATAVDSPFVVHTPRGTFVRSEPNKTSDKVVDYALPNNAPVKPTGKKVGNWVEIEIDGKLGYVYNSLLQDTRSGDLLNATTEAGVCLNGKCPKGEVGHAKNVRDIKQIKEEIDKPKEDNDDDDDDEKDESIGKKILMAPVRAVKKLFGLLSPVNGTPNPRRGFQMVSDPWSGRRYHHAGQDYIAGYGTPVKAVKGGRVVAIVKNCYDRPSGSGQTRRCGGGLGNYVKVQHPDGHYSIYSHLENSSHCNVLRGLRTGVTVQPGKVVGCVGSSGRATGPHLFFEVQNSGGTPVNPISYMKQRVAAE